jgi:two-component system response regulator RegA
MSMDEDIENGGDDRLLLIIEDDDAFARTLGRSFERRGYQVLQAPGLDEAQELLSTSS